MKNISSSMIADLNRDHDSGIYFEAVIVTRNMLSGVKDYLAKFQRPFTFDGNEYTPSYLEFSGLDKNVEMKIATNQCNIANVAGVVDDYLHDPTLKIKNNDIMFQIMHLNLNGEFELADQDLLAVQFVRASLGAGSAVIFSGWNMRLNDRVPRGTIENKEFPGIPANQARVGV